MKTTDTFQSLFVRLSLFGLLAAAAGSTALGTQPNLPGDWPTYGNGPAHTGYFPGKLNGLPLVLKWKAPMLLHQNSGRNLQRMGCDQSDAVLEQLDNVRLRDQHFAGTISIHRGASGQPCAALLPRFVPVNSR